jgi:hypothetical protein
MHNGHMVQEKLQRRRKRAYKPAAADADDKLQQIEQADASIAVKKVKTALHRNVMSRTLTVLIDHEHDCSSVSFHVRMLLHVYAHNASVTTTQSCSHETCCNMLLQTRCTMPTLQHRNCY